MKKLKESALSLGKSPFMIPIMALLFLVVFNFLRDPDFFIVSLITNSYGDKVLSGTPVSILNGASELAILAMGMTLVTAACGGQDISVGANMAIAGSVYVRLLSILEISWSTIVLAFVVGVIVACIFSALSGTLVAVFKIQPMIATLILFTIGRSIAYWINGGATPTLSDPRALYAGSFIPGIAIPASFLVVVVFGCLMALVLKFSNLGLYAQAVGANENAARLNGINTVGIKLLVFIILGLCTAIAGPIAIGRLGLINHETIGLGIEMDAILAVAIGGNSLGGGKFDIKGSVVGAYVIEMLTRTLYAMKVPSTDVQAYKAVVIIILVLVSSPLVQEKLFKRKDKAVQKAKEDNPDV